MYMHPDYNVIHALHVHDGCLSQDSGTVIKQGKVLRRNSLFQSQEKLTAITDVSEGKMDTVDVVDKEYHWPFSVYSKTE